MKKIVSLLLALAMVLSMGAIAFAEEPESESNAPAETPTVEISEIIDLFKQMLPQIDLKNIGAVFEETKVTLEKIASVIGPLFGTEQGKPSFSVAEVPAIAMNGFIDAVAALFGTDREVIIEKLLEIPLVKIIMGWYGYQPAETTEAPATEAPTEAPTEASSEEVPKTGAAAGIAAFASLSVAAAAAFVSKKRKAA